MVTTNVAVLVWSQIESTVNSFAKNDQKPDGTSVLYHQIWHQRSVNFKEPYLSFKL